MRPVFIRDGTSFSFYLLTARKNRKQGLSPSSARILRLVDVRIEPGSIAALLHREGLYSSCLTDLIRLASKC